MLLLLLLLTAGGGLDAPDVGAAGAAACMLAVVGMPMMSFSLSLTPPKLPARCTLEVLPPASSRSLGASLLLLPEPALCPAVELRANRASAANSRSSSMAGRADASPASLGSGTASSTQYSTLLLSLVTLDVALVLVPPKTSSIEAYSSGLTGAAG